MTFMDYVRSYLPPLSTVQLHLTLIFAIIVSTLDYLHNNKALFNPFYSDDVTKLTESMKAKVICSVTGGIIAYIFTIMVYSPSAPLKALFAGFLVVPFVHDGRISKLVADHSPIKNNT